jgi:hypothetical protein
VNSSVEDFVEAIKRPDAIAAGYIGQFIIKPLFGFLFGTLAVTVLNLPTALEITCRRQRDDVQHCSNSCCSNCSWIAPE